MQKLSIRTDARTGMVDITDEVQGVVRESGWGAGVLVVYCPHTSGGVTINEGADPDVVRDVVVNMNRLVPREGDYRHAEGNSDAHIKASLFGCSVTCIVEDGRVQLGTWQRIFFCEFDGPRSRTVWVSFVGD